MTTTSVSCDRASPVKRGEGEAGCVTCETLQIVRFLFAQLTPLGALCMDSDCIVCEFS